MRFLGCVILAVIWSVGPVTSTWSQSSTAATPASISAGSPSTLAIKKDLLVAARTELQRQLRDVQRCIDQATHNLRDAAGLVNRIASTDLVTCSRSLNQIQRKLVSLGRKADTLARDAEVMAANLETVKRRLETKERIKTGLGN